MKVNYFKEDVVEVVEPVVVIPKSQHFREDLVLKNNSIVGELQKVIPLGRQVKKPLARISIEIILANLLHANGAVRIDFSNRYKVSPHRSYTAERKVIVWLESKEYIHLYKAPSNPALKALKDQGQDVTMHYENGIRRQSCIWLSDAGKQYLGNIQVQEMLVVRRKHIKATKKAKERYDYYPFLKSEVARVKQYEELLADLNQLMSGHVLQYVGKDDDGNDKLVTFTNDTRIVFTGTDKNLITNTAVQGGRYISPVSSLYKPYRKTTTINGRSTVEADFKCCLPSIMFGLLKVDLLALERDLYYVSGEIDCEDLRMLVKAIVVAMLGTTSKYGLKLALDKKLRDYETKQIVNGYVVERFFPIAFTIEDIRRVAGKIIARYEALGDVNTILFKGKDSLATNRLQAIEAKIATAVIRDFVSKGKPILAIHDSFRVLEEDKELLVDLMNKYFIRFVGMPPFGITVTEPSKENSLYWLPESSDSLENDEECVEDNLDWSFIDEDHSELFDSPEWQCF